MVQVLIQKAETLIKSPLRYPGGKSKAINQILPLVPQFEEFREPLVGGGSVFFALKQLYPTKKFVINDLNQDLFCFWKYCQTDVELLIETVQKFKAKFKDGRFLHSFLSENIGKTSFEKAVRFFILNRVTFSGLADSGGYSEQAFEKRFTESSIERLRAASKLLQGVSIRNNDYSELMSAPGSDVFIFLDPPYLSKTKSKLYGKKGDLHESFDHTRFAELMKNCKHKWLITYDDSPEVRALFSFANIYEWELQYGMNNYKQDFAAKGKELFISNYKIPFLERKSSTTQKTLCIAY